MTRRSEIFRLVEPPPGGLALLRERLEQKRRSRSWMVALPAAAVVAAAIVLSVRPAPIDPVRAGLLSDPLTQSLGLRPAQAETALGEERTALVPIASENPSVAVYWADGLSEVAPHGEN